MVSKPLCTFWAPGSCGSQRSWPGREAAGSRGSWRQQLGRFQVPFGFASILRPQKQSLEVRARPGYNAEVWNIWKLWKTSVRRPMRWATARLPDPPWLYPQTTSGLRTTQHCGAALLLVCFLNSSLFQSPLELLSVLLLSRRKRQREGDAFRFHEDLQSTYNHPAVRNFPAVGWWKAGFRNPGISPTWALGEWE